jgi:hypothetical protein
MRGDQNGGAIMDDVKRILIISRSTKYCRKAVHYGISLREHTETGRMKKDGLDETPFDFTFQ